MPSNNTKGISLIALIITIIVIIILAVIVIKMATGTPEKAKTATFIADISEIQQGVEIKKAMNYMPNPDGTMKDVNTGFTKISIKKTPYGVAEDGWVVNLDEINIKNSTRGNDYNDIAESSVITFGDGAPDIYVYDNNGIVYYAPGQKDETNTTIYTKNDASNSVTGVIEAVEPSNPAQWTFNTTTGVITKYTGPDVQELIIPNQINGVKVNSMVGSEDDWEGIIRPTSTIQSIIISPGITSIGDYAFNICRNIKSISIPNTVTSIGENAFYGCQQLVDIEIPNSVTRIGPWSFYYCWRLPSITIPNSVTSIEQEAFEWCEGFTEITIPSSVTTIGLYVFSGCNKLSEINVESGNPNYKSIEGVLFSKNGTILYQCPENLNKTDYNIPDGVITIKSWSIESSIKLRSITIPSSVTNIEDCAIACNLLLTSVIIDANNPAYKMIDGVLFNKSGTMLHTYLKARSGTTYSIPEGVTSIGEEAFYYCTSLTSITLPNTLTTIEPWAFESCTNMTSITIPSSVTSIGSNAFYACTKLAQIIINKTSNSIPGAKWGAPASTVVSWSP
jgi:Tfp pilus assembly major pilin PilA